MLAWIESFRPNAVQIVLLLLALTGLFLVIYSTVRHGRRRGNSESHALQGRYADLRRDAQNRRELEEVMRQLDLLAQRIDGRLDARMARLESLIRTADQRIETLAGVARGSNGTSSLDITLDEGTATLEPPREPVSEHGAHTDVIRLAEEGKSIAIIAAETGRTAGEVELILSLRRVRAQAESVFATMDSANTNRGTKTERNRTTDFDGRMG